MKMTVDAFSKKLFGVTCERLPRTLLMDLVVFFGLYIAGFQVQIAPSVRVLTISAFTAGVMWQALSSQDNAVELRHMLMLPLCPRTLVFSYVAVLGAYTVLTKTGMLLAVLLAVAVWTPMEIAGILVCMIHAVLMAAAVYSLKKYWYAGGLWTAAVMAAVFLLEGRLLAGLLSVNGLLAVLLLQRADVCVFYRQESGRGRAVKQQKTASLWRYFFRYLSFHKNYLLNTAAMWCAALVMPYFLREMAGLSAAPVGFAILSLNTPVCILLSCDRDLEQAVRFLPGQKKAFCVPYCLFIFLCNMAADALFLCSWQIQNGGVTVFMIAGAVFFALQSAALSALLEWFYPVRDWKIESDLWRHPRKYMVPAVMLLLAGAVSACPMLLPVLLVLLALEAAAFLALLASEGR